MLLPKFERSLKVTHRLEDQHLNLLMLSGEIHPASHVQALFQRFVWSRKAFQAAV